MFLQSLSLQNFRNYKKKSFDFSGNTTLIVGPNASGKTNILEAIYLLSRGKSFRASMDREMIRYGEELARVGGKIFYNGTARNAFLASSVRDSVNRSLHQLTGPMLNIAKNDYFALPQKTKIKQASRVSELEVVLTTGQVQGKKTARKLFKVNGVGRRWRDFVGNLLCVLFRPEDIEIVLGSPSMRRDYLDSVLEQVDSEYRRSSLAYYKGLHQRNRLLDKIREGRASRTQLEFWSRLLCKNGEIISRKREEFVEFINGQWLNGSMAKWFNSLAIFYDKSVISPARLEKYAQAEIAFGATLVGPQRDEIKFKMQNAKIKMTPKEFFQNSTGQAIQNSKLDNAKDLSLFGSRGEQRMTILALKLAELEFVNKKSSERPVLLLDDIFSELDSKNRQLVLSTIPHQQTIITTTDPHLVEKKFLDRIETKKLRY